MHGMIEFTLAYRSLLPDVYFLWNLHPWPLLVSDTKLDAAPPRTAPVFSLCKRPNDLDVLYPNMYFGGPSNWHRVTAALNGSSRRSW